MNSATSKTVERSEYSGFSVPHLDVSHLVGHTIMLFSEQFPGKPITCRVVHAKSREIELDSLSSQSTVANLVNNQKIVVCFPFEGQSISVQALLRKSDGNRCILLLDKQAVPLSQRRFERYPCNWQIKLATYPLTGSRPRQLNELRWFETESVNLSGGGALIVLPGFLNEGVMVLVHLASTSISLPSILLGQIRHCYELARSRYLAGIEFITSDIGRSIVPADRRSVFPASVFEFTELERKRIDRELRIEAQESPREE